MKTKGQKSENQSFNKDCVVYFRVSRTVQETERQRMECLQYCKDNGFNIITDPFEEKISGRKRDRKEMTKCLNFIKENNIHYLILSEISRISRSLEGGSILDRLTQDKVCIIALKEEIKTFNDDWTINHKHIEMALFAVSQAIKESNYISMRTKSGKKAKVVYTGAWTGGKFLPYGYKSQNKKLVIDPAEAEIVKQIFEKYLSGWGSIKISNWLNLQNIKTKLNSKWIRSTINQMIPHRIYIGKRQFNNGEIETPELRILDDDTFYLAQKRMKERKNTDISFNKQRKYDYLFTGIMKCGVCEKSFIGVNRYNIYKCSTGKYSKGCGNNSVKMDFIEEYVQGYILTNLSELVKSNTDINLKISEMNLEINLLNQSLSEELDKQKRINQMFEKGRMTDIEYDQKYELIDNYITTLREKIKTLKNHITELQIRVNQSSELFNNVISKYNEFGAFDKNKNVRMSADSIQTMKDVYNITDDVIRKIISKVIIHKKDEGHKWISVELINGNSFDIEYKKEFDINYRKIEEKLK